jgi:hypothetical protein
MAVNVNSFVFGTETGTQATHGTLPNNPTSYSGNINAADKDVVITRDVSNAATFFLRILLQSPGTASNNFVAQLTLRKNAGGFNNVTTTSNNVKAVTTSIFTDASTTTSRLSGTGTFIGATAASHDGSAGGASLDVVASGNTEVLYSLQLVPADLVAGDVLQFRIAAASAFNVTPQITLTTPDFTAAPTTVAATVTEFVPTVAADATLAPAPVAAVITGLAPTVSAHFTAEASPAAVAITGLVPDVSTGLSERLTPNAVVAGGSNLRDTLTNSPPQRFADVDEPTGSDDTEWWTAVVPTNDIDIRVGFPPSSGNLVGQQMLRALIRGTSLPSRDVTLELWESGVKLTSEITESVSSVSGQVVTLTFDASELSDVTGAGVELRIRAAA